MRRLWIVIAVGVACACGDAFAPGHSRAALNLVPTFSENVYELLTGDLDELRVRVSHIPGGAVVLDTTVAVDTAGNVDLDLSVTLSAQTDSFAVLLEGIRSSDSTVLYSGFDTVVVRSGETTPPGDTIAVNYVGPCPQSAKCTVAVAPQDSILSQGDSVTMRVAVVDSLGASVPGVPVSITNLSPGLVAVSATRHVRALTGSPGGGALVAATIHGPTILGVADTLRLTIAPSGSPAIGLNPTSITFTATAGGSDPAPQTVSVTNAGIGTLSGLSAPITYVTGTPGWLAAGLSTTTAPATLTLTPTLGSLATGTYTATVTVSSSLSGVAPQAVSVTFTVNASAPAVVIVTPGYAALRIAAPGNTAQLADTVKDGSGNVLSPSLATWTSRSPGVATVSIGGLVTATGRGVATIVAGAGTGADSIMVAVGDTANHGDMLLFALTTSRAFGQRTVGQTAPVDFIASHAAVPADSLASYTIRYAWNKTVLRFDSVRAGTFTGALPAGLNTDSTANGVLIFADINVNGAGGTPVLLHVFFTALAPGSDAHSLQIQELSGSAPTYVNFYQLVQYLVVSGNATISP